MLRKNDDYYEKIEDLSGLSKNHPILAFFVFNNSFFISRNSSSSRFFCKILYIYVCNRKSMYFLAVIGLLSTVIAAFYYLRIIKIIYFDPEKQKYETNHPLGLKITLILSTIFIIVYFIYPS